MNKISNIFKGILLLIIAIFLYNTIIYYSYPDEISYVNTLAFKDKQKNSIDYIFMGSSHVYKGIIPEVFDYKLNVNSYNYATSNNIIEYNYIQTKEILKTQSPKYIFLDLFNLIDRIDDDVALHKAIDTIELSPLKYQTIKKYNKDEPINEMLFPIIKYHLEWKNKVSSEKIAIRSKIKSQNIYKGYQFKTDKFNDNDVPLENIAKTNEKLYLSEDRKNALDDIVNLCKENNIELVFFVVPFIDSEIFSIEDLQKYKNGLIEQYPEHTFIDLNLYYDEIGLTNKDFYDMGHLNVYGAYKTTLFLSDYIKKNNFITNTLSEDMIQNNIISYQEFYADYKDALLEY